MRLSDFLVDVGRPVAYYPELSHITGGVKETLFLCQLLYWNGKQNDSGGWIYKTQQEMFEETGLTRREQETARRNLKKKGFIEETLKGVPAKLHYRVDCVAIDTAWVQFVQNRQTRMAETAKLDCTNAPNKYGGMSHTIYTENTTENTTKEEVDYQKIVDLYHSKCTSLPKIMKLSTSRRKGIKARLNDLGMDGLITLFEKAEASDFLSGRNGVWKNCNFDWLLKEANSLKVLEGNYDNTKGQATSNNSNDNSYYGDFEYQIGEGRLTTDGVIVKND